MLPRESRRQFGRDALAMFLATFTPGSVRSAELLGAEQSNAESSTPIRRDLIKQALPGEPARNITLVEVQYPPGASSPPHLHVNGAMAYVVSGAIASQVNKSPERVFNAGEAWWEPPGSIHRVSRNASTAEPATLLAIYIAPADAKPTDFIKPL
jgi:quercetin dioxygenase-like cupin family protein